MSYSITCSTKILALAIALVLFISVSVLCEFGMSDVQILLSLQDEEVYKYFFYKKPVNKKLEAGAP